MKNTGNTVFGDIDGIKGMFRNLRHRVARVLNCLFEGLEGLQRIGCVIVVAKGTRIVQDDLWGREVGAITHGFDPLYKSIT